MYLFVEVLLDLSYFSIAAIKHYDQGNVRKKEFSWGLQFQRISVHDHHGREHGIRNKRERERQRGRSEATFSEASAIQSVASEWRKQRLLNAVCGDSFP